MPRSVEREGLISRRALLLSAGSLAALASRESLAASSSRFKAIVFDGFPIFDPRPVAALAESLYPGRGAALMNAWRTRQFEYQWLRALGGQYADFTQVTLESLRFALRQHGIESDAKTIERLAHSFFEMPVWTDVPAAVEALRAADIRLAFLSNMTRSMLEDGLRRAQLRKEFEALLSTDSAKTYKPDPRAYAMATSALSLHREEILFVAFAGWDAAGAKWFGYPTFWMNRSQAPSEELGITVDGVGTGMGALLDYAR